MLLEHYPVSAERSEASKRSNYWEGAVIENQSAQLICLRDMLSLLEFVAKVAPSEEIDNLNRQILALLLALSEEKSEEIFALISLIEKADYQKSVEAFKVYSEKYCSVENQSLDQIITVSTRFLERTVKENSPKDGVLALENIFKVLVKDKSYLKRIVLDMAKAIFPSLRDKVVVDAAQKIRKENTGGEELQNQISKLLKLSFVGADFSGMKTEKTVKMRNKFLTKNIH